MHLEPRGSDSAFAYPWLFAAGRHSLVHHISPPLLADVDRCVVIGVGFVSTSATEIDTPTTGLKVGALRRGLGSLRP